MKRIFLSTFLTITFFSSAFSNNKAYQTRINYDNFLLVNNIKSDEELISIYSKIEDVHGKGLDFIFSFFQKSIQTNSHFKISTSELEKVIDDYIVKEYKVNGIILSQIYSNQTAIFSSDIASIPFFETITNETRQKFSDNFEMLLSEFQKFVIDESINKDYNFYDSFVKSKISALDSEQEKIALITLVYTGKSSVKYWNENMEKWNTINQDISTASRQHPGQTIIAADMVGGAAGAVMGAYAGATGGTVALPGIGTVAGVAAGFFVGGAVGGIRSSGMAACTALLSHWFRN